MSAGKWLDTALPLCAAVAWQTHSTSHAAVPIATIGRNALCPCGIGKKYKKCHGQEAALVVEPTTANLTPERVFRIFAEVEAKRRQQELQQGLGKPIISAELNGYRFIVVGNTVHYSCHWRTFHEFLADYLKLVIGKESWFSWIDKERENLHPIMLWAKLTTEQQGEVQIESGQVNSIEATGAMYALYCLSYDLYCLAHNVELQAKLVARIKNPDQFWGARYEVFAAAALIRAGFLLEFENEDDRASTHCEFTATNQKTGRKFSVEAKHLAGTQFRFGRQLNRVLKKAAKYERIVFMDVNVPSDSAVDQVAVEPLHRAVRDVRLFENQLIAGKVLPPAYLVITNKPQHHHLNSTAFRPGAVLEGFRTNDFKFDANYPAGRDAIESLERHRELHELAVSLRIHSVVPSTFDGEISGA